MWKLQIVDDQGQRSEVPLNGSNELTIGRHESNAIRLMDRNVSRRHARISQRSGDVYIEDIGSSFGIRLNGETVSERTALHAGDRVQIGDYLLMLRSDAANDIINAENEDEFPVYADGRPVLINRAERGRLIVTSTNLHGLEYSLDRTPLVLGRAEECGIRLEHRSVSNEHARILFKDGAYTVEDMGSSNGLKINGESYTTATLRDGDEIELGHVKLRFVAPGSTGVAAAIPPVDDTGHTGSGGAKKFALFVVTAVGVGLVVAWFGYFSKPAEPGRGRQTAVAVHTPQPSPQPEPGLIRPSTEVAVVESTQNNEQNIELAENRPETPSAAENAGPDENVGVAEPGSPNGVATITGNVAEAGQVAVDGSAATAAEQVAVVDSAAGDLDAAKTAMSTKQWESAIAAYDRVLAKNANEAEARAGRDRAVVEQQRRDKIAAADAIYHKGQVAGAFTALKAAQTSIPNESAYSSDVNTRLSKWKPEAIAALVADGKTALQRGDAKKAVKLADSALSIDKKNPAAKDLAKMATKAMKTTAVAGATTATSDSSSKPVTVDTGAKSVGATTEGLGGKELYAEGRKAATAGQDSIALGFFEKSLGKGYSMAHKQLGVIYARRGEAKKAVEHYEAYLQAHKDAPDADSVRTAVERLRK